MSKSWIVLSLLITILTPTICFKKTIQLFSSLFPTINDLFVFATRAYLMSPFAKRIDSNYCGLIHFPDLLEILIFWWTAVYWTRGSKTIRYFSTNDNRLNMSNKVIQLEVMRILSTTAWLDFEIWYFYEILVLVIFYYEYFGTFYDTFLLL